MNKKNIKLFAFDLDGTLYLGDRAVPGAVELVRELRRGHQVVYFTNNSTKTTGQIRDKLLGLKFDCEPNEIYTSAASTAVYLKESGLDQLFLVGAPGLRDELEHLGLRLAEAEAAKHLVVGLDTDFNYHKLAQALAVLLRGGKFIVCNEDNTFPAGDGKYLPGCGALVGAIAAAAQRRPDYSVGKPNTYILSRIAGDHQVSAREIMVVGDSYESDIAMALKYDCQAVLLGARAAVDRRVIVKNDLHSLAEYLGRDNK